MKPPQGNDNDSAMTSQTLHLAGILRHSQREPFENRRFQSHRPRALARRLR